MSIAVNSRSDSRTRTGSAAGVRVNLLPQVTRANAKATRQRAVAGLLGGLLVAGMGATWWHAAGQVTAAEEELAAQEATTQVLRQEVSELDNFRVMATQRDAAIAALQLTLADEVSVAGVLQDFALVVPPDTEFQTLNIQFAAEDGRVGNFVVTGRTLTAHAPGVERTLAQLNKVGGLSDLYLNSSSLDDTAERVATFSIDGNVGRVAATDRYADGLPEELR